MKRRYTKRAPLILCPHCQAPAEIRRSEQVTPLVRELSVMCDNDACAHRFVVQIVAARTIQPSLRPNPAVSLPLWRPKPANDVMPAPANDDRPAVARTMPS